jgi:hypothetical protein
MDSKNDTYITNLDSYKQAFYLVAHRLRFDLDARLWAGRKRTSQLGDKYNGKKCIILCNGPSLNSVDFNRLRELNIFTIGLNKINLMFDSNEFRPDIIACVNSFVIDQNMDFYLQTEIPLFLDYAGVKRTGRLGELSRKANAHLLHSANVVGQFSKNITKNICQGYTVTYVAFQVAYFLGFTEIALVGCDHNFASKGATNSTIQQKTTEENHFIPNYFAPGSFWQLPDLLGSEFHYQIAKEIFEQNRRNVFNCTTGGKLEIFNRISLDQFINS